MKIGIVGSGALGLYYGALLQRSGQDVHFLLRRDYLAISTGGLYVHSCNGDFHLPTLSAYRDTGEIGEVDLVLVGLKTISNQYMLDLVRPLIGDSTAILTLQNGLGNEELLAEEFGAERVLGGVAFLCSNRGEPGNVHHLGAGEIRLGEYDGGLSQRSKDLATMFNNAGVQCEAVADLRRARWEKLVWNIPFNGLAALLGKDVTEILSHPWSNDLVRELMLEVIAAANAQTIDIPIDAAQFSQQLIEFTEEMDHYRPSMMIDRAEGRALELEAIYAVPLQYARQSGVSMPRVEMLFALLDIGE
ncbi:MAG: 2-dehydropantoate 2-reductase [Desulfobacteraceae bacterium 4572_35.1]|nr:MAG: 2-dehydropantoate 2-reductase [Desulfobacteraceae bacterium 4572_35.1]